MDSTALLETLKFWGSTANHLASVVPIDVWRGLASFAAILFVLFWLAAIYRGRAGDEEIETPVTLATLSTIGEREIVFGPRHFREREVHSSKAPRVVFYVQLPDRGKYDAKAADLPLSIRVRSKNSKFVFDQDYNTEVTNGGQVGIEQTTRAALEAYFEKLRVKEGRSFDPDTAKFIIKLKYPSRVNLDYLLREHPDASVRVGAWIFILTSLYSLVQELIFR